MKAAAIKFEVGEEIAPQDLQKISDGMDIYSIQKAGIVWKSLSIVTRDASGDMIGGLTGFIAGKTLLIKLLWIDEAHRRFGLGGDMMRHAEAEAKKQGCNSVHVDTFSYQAPDFYKKLGYNLKATIHNVIEGQDRFFFEKKVI